MGDDHQTAGLEPVAQVVADFVGGGLEKDALVAIGVEVELQDFSSTQILSAT